MIVITSAGLSDIGRKRHSNQDVFLMDDAHGLYVVADGMGGHQAGEVAAQIVVDSIHQYYAASPPNADQETTRHDPSLSPDANRLREAIHYANQKVYQAAAGNKAYQGMGSTLAAVHFSLNTFIAANVGDSRVYHFDGEVFSRVTIDHSLVEQLVLQGAVTAEVHAAAISGAKRRIAASHTEAFIMKMPLFQK